MSVSVTASLSVCLSVYVSEHISETARPNLIKFLCMLPVVMALFSSASIAICYVLPVLLIVSRLFMQWTQWRRVATTATSLQRRARVNFLLHHGIGCSVGRRRKNFIHFFSILLPLRAKKNDKPI